MVGPLLLISCLAVIIRSSLATISTGSAANLPQYCMVSIDVKEIKDNNPNDQESSISKNGRPISFSGSSSKSSDTVSYLSDLQFNSGKIEYTANSISKNDFMKGVDECRKEKDVMFYIPSKAPKNPASIFRESKKISDAYDQHATVVPCLYPTLESEYFVSEVGASDVSSTDMASNLKDLIGHFKGKCDIFAHGTGADIFQKFSQKGFSVPEKSVANIFLFAPDLNSNLFTTKATDAGKRVGRFISEVSDQFYVFYSHGDTVLKSIDSGSKESSLGLSGAIGMSIVPEIKNLHTYCCDRISGWSDPFRRHFYYDDGDVKEFLNKKIKRETKT